LSKDEIGAEQEIITKLYRHLDGLREQAAERLRESLRGEAGGTHQARSERDSATSRYRTQIQQWDAAEHGLCFGRLDFINEDQLHIGRLGLFDESEDYEPLLIDWRAPAARPFYLATAVSPGSVRRRRHIRTRLREVIDVDDEVLDLTEAQQDSAEGGNTLVGEAALMGALNAGRTGRMKDIVETIQAEQDQIIRSALSGVLVVQGGPGTGKTAVALHRAAYLLYTHRESLTRQGVLILGPNETFLRYISQVLPGLGETSVLLGTLGDLFPTVRARATEPAETAQFKGSLEMTELIAGAIRDSQQVPDEHLEVVLNDSHEGFGYQREKVLIHRATVEQARDNARRSGRPHNLARPLFVEEIIYALSRQIAEQQGFDPFAGESLGGDDAPGEGTILLDEADLAEIRRELRLDNELHAALDTLWPRLTPQRLLSKLFAGTDNELLRRDPGHGWTPADVPLLDEAAEQLGEDEMTQAETAERLRQISYAEGVLDISAGSALTDVEVGEESEVLLATDLLDAGSLAERQVFREELTAAQHAAADRRWAFGHVIVDEAQELSPMAWRLLMRRSPNRSMTVVGDVAQTGTLSGANSWDDVFAPYVQRRWRLTELTVNYRTPAEIMELAAEVLAEIDPALVPPQSVRRTGLPPRYVKHTEASLPELIEEERALGGKLGVIVPQADEPSGPADLDSDVTILTVRQAKGLEFDSVIVVDPERIKSESPRGRNDLYVALTRATQRLTLLV
jgi:DNA helicase IV